MGRPTRAERFLTLVVLGLLALAALGCGAPDMTVDRGPPGSPPAAYLEVTFEWVLVDADADPETAPVAMLLPQVIHDVRQVPREAAFGVAGQDTRWSWGWLGDPVFWLWAAAAGAVLYLLWPRLRALLPWVT